LRALENYIIKVTNSRFKSKPENLIILSSRKNIGPKLPGQIFPILGGKPESGNPEKSHTMLFRKIVINAMVPGNPFRRVQFPGYYG
jgi:hypothetical protein